jgi:hypothetical protein
VISGVGGDDRGAVGDGRTVDELDAVVIGVDGGGSVVIGVVPEDDVVVIAPGIPTDAEVEIEAGGEREGTLDVLVADAVL